MKYSTNKITIYWFMIFVLCSIAYQFIQDTLRPQYDGDNVMIRYFLGIAPYFFPAIGLPALFVILIPQLFGNENNKRWLHEQKHITANIISMTGLILWEFMQVNGNLHFDWNDILWTCIGAFVFQVIWYSTPDTKKVIQSEY
jgi:hypothetical protein